MRRAVDAGDDEDVNEICEVIGLSTRQEFALQSARKMSLEIQTL